MSQDLSDRLAKLEYEIHSLLTVQSEKRSTISNDVASKTAKPKQNDSDQIKNNSQKNVINGIFQKGQSVNNIDKKPVSSSGCECCDEPILNCNCYKNDCRCHILASRQRRESKNAEPNLSTQSASDANFETSKSKLGIQSRLPRLVPKIKKDSSTHSIKPLKLKNPESQKSDGDMVITTSEDSFQSIESFHRQDVHKQFKEINLMQKNSDSSLKSSKSVDTKHENEFVRDSPSNETLVSVSETCLRNRANTLAKEDNLKKRTQLKEKPSLKKQRSSLISVFETIEEEKTGSEISDTRPQTAHKFASEKFFTIPHRKSIVEKLREEKQEQEKTEVLIAQLKEEIKTNQLEIEELARGKRAATEVAQSLRKKYESMNESRQKIVTELSELRKINVTLSQRLEQEIKNRERSLREMKEKTYAEIKNYLKTQFSLNKKSAEEREKVLNENNEKLINDLATERKKTQKAELAQSQMEIKLKEIQSQATNAWGECARLKNELQASKEYAKSTKEERDNLRVRVSELENKVGCIVRSEKQLQLNATSLNVELTAKTKLALEMQEKCQQLEKELQLLQENDMKKVKIVETELQRFAKVMKEKEALLLDEKSHLTKIVKDLNELVKTHKTRIDDLTALNIQQEKHLEENKRTILEKEEIIKYSKKTIELLKEQKCELEMRVNELGKTSSEILRLKKSISDKNIVINNGKEKIISLEKELEEAKKLIQHEKDDTLLKQKIIDDQAATIKTLKDQNQGSYANLVTLQNITKDLENLQGELCREREQKEKISNTLTEVRKENEHLLMQVNELDHELIMAHKNREDQNSRKRQSDILSELEVKLSEQQQKWNIQRQILVREKNQAVAAARFATKKLVETVMEFQNQVEAQKRVQQTLTLMLSEKDAQLRNANQKIKNLSGTSQTENPIRVDLERKIHDAYDACSNVIQHMRCGLNFVARSQQNPAEEPTEETFAEQFIS